MVEKAWVIELKTRHHLVGDMKRRIENIQDSDIFWLNDIKIALCAFEIPEVFQYVSDVF